MSYNESIIADKIEAKTAVNDKVEIRKCDGNSYFYEENAAYLTEITDKGIKAERYDGYLEMSIYSDKQGFDKKVDIRVRLETSSDN